MTTLIERYWDAYGQMIDAGVLDLAQAIENFRKVAEELKAEERGRDILVQLTLDLKEKALGA